MILFCTIVCLILQYHSEASYARNYQYNENKKNYQRYIRNRNIDSSTSIFINPFRNYDPSYLNSDVYGAPIPNNIEELMIGQMPPIPAAYANLADVDPDFMRQEQQLNEIEPKNGKEGVDTEKGQPPFYGQKLVPFYWHIPRTGGATISQAFGECLGLTIASSASSIPSSSHSMESFRKIFFDENQQSVNVLRHKEGKYVNVNLGTDAGILRARELQILQQQTNDENEGENQIRQRPLVDVVQSPSVYATSKVLFAPSDHLSTSTPSLSPKGQLFTMMRNPVEREVSYFYFLKQEQEEFAYYEISDWLTSPLFLDNMMVRSLINNFDRSYFVTVQDLLVAKEVLRRKCLVGLLEEKGASWRRMRKYFGISWNHQSQYIHHKDGPSKRKCEQKLFFWGWNNRNPNRPYVGHGGESITRKSNEEIVDRASYEQIKLINRWDVLLYEYARYLFKQQGIWLGFDDFDETIDAERNFDES